MAIKVVYKPPEGRYVAGFAPGQELTCTDAEARAYLATGCFQEVKKETKKKEAEE